jgi:hypothetical protein
VFIREGHTNLAKNLLNVQPLDKAVSKLLPAFFDSYGSLDTATPSSYILWSDDKNGPLPFSSLGFICHNKMPYLNKGFDHLITAAPKVDEISLAYLRMLISGPFRSVSDLIAIEQYEDKFYINCSNLSKWPANVLYNFCIATRTPIEFSMLLPRWHDLVQEGYNETLAFLLSASTFGSKFEYNRSMLQSRYGHMWLDEATCWAKVISGSMSRITSDFKTSPGACKPCNIIWTGSQSMERFRKMSDKDISEALGLPIGPVVVEPPAKPPVLKKKKGIYGNFAPQFNPAPIHPWVNAEVVINPVDAHWFNVPPVAPAPPMHVIDPDPDDAFDDFPEPDFDDDNDDEHFPNEEDDNDF